MFQRSVSALKVASSFGSCLDHQMGISTRVEFSAAGRKKRINVRATEEGRERRGTRQTNAQHACDSPRILPIELSRPRANCSGLRRRCAARFEAPKFAAVDQRDAKNTVLRRCRPCQPRSQNTLILFRVPFQRRVDAHRGNFRAVRLQVYGLSCTYFDRSPPRLPTPLSRLPLSYCSNYCLVF